MPKIEVDQEDYFAMLEEITQLRLNQHAGDCTKLSYSLLQNSISLDVGVQGNVLSISEFLRFSNVKHSIITWTTPLDVPFVIRDTIFDSPVGSISESKFLALEIESTSPINYKEYKLIPVTIDAQVIGLFAYNRASLNHSDASAIELICFQTLQAAFLFERAHYVLSSNKHSLNYDTLMQIRNNHALNEDYSSFTPLHVAMSDIDSFKKVNDNYGHKMGDTVLQAFGKVLKEHSSRNVTPYRYGGDEIIVLSDDIAALQSFVAAVSKDFAALVFTDEHGNSFSCTISVGIASNCPDITLGRAWADYAMYTVKKTTKAAITSIECNTTMPDIQAIQRERS